MVGKANRSRVWERGWFTLSGSRGQPGLVTGRLSPQHGLSPWDLSLPPASDPQKGLENHLLDCVHFPSLGTALADTLQQGSPSPKTKWPGDGPRMLFLAPSRPSFVPSAWSSSPDQGGSLPPLKHRSNITSSRSLPRATCLGLPPQPISECSLL